MSFKIHRSIQKSKLPVICYSVPLIQPHEAGGYIFFSHSPSCYSTLHRNSAVLRGTHFLGYVARHQFRTLKQAAVMSSLSH